MVPSRVERRLTELGFQLRGLREELAVADEQLAHLTESADEARLRSLVSETPLAGREHREAQRHADAMARHREELLGRVEAIEAAQDDLLDELNAQRVGR